MNADGSEPAAGDEAQGARASRRSSRPTASRSSSRRTSDDPKGRNFDLYLINVDGTGLERVTYNDTFDGFPMFSPDGKQLVFASNRNDAKPGETNVFIADWK